MQNQIPPTIGPNGHDLYPFTLVTGKHKTRFAHWFDVVIAQRAVGAATPHAKVRIEGNHPSHTMVPWVTDIKECSVCNGLETTLSVIIPCGTEKVYSQSTLFEAAKEARARAEQGDLS